MGTCESANAEGNRKARNGVKDQEKIRELEQKCQNQQKQTHDSSLRMDEEEEETDKRVEILKRGQKKEIQKLLDNYEDINDYTFGTNKTILLEGVITCSKPLLLI